MGGCLVASFFWGGEGRRQKTEFEISDEDGFGGFSIKRGLTSLT